MKRKPFAHNLCEKQLFLYQTDLLFRTLWHAMAYFFTVLENIKISLSNRLCLVMRTSLHLLAVFTLTRNHVYP